MYVKYFKRLIDFLLALTALVLLSPILLILTVAGMVVMRGNPFFVQPRPGKRDKDGKEKIFYLIKFRTMNGECDEYGELLPDEQRLGRYGAGLRNSSADELPSLINVLKGDMALCGPRPQLVRDMTFMTEKQRRRHDVRPGLTGLAQINGRNNITWERKFEYDLQYINDGITLLEDTKILLKTVGKLKREDIVREKTVSDIDFGDWLMLEGKVDRETYDKRQEEAKELLRV